MPVEDDGLTFPVDMLVHEEIVKDAEYKGTRFRFLGLLGKIRIPMQIDFGFGDIVYPDPEETALTSILDFPAPRLRCYSRESVVAEKFEVMVKMGALNSRMKDFYDIWLIANRFDFEAARLGEAIRRTFSHRGTLHHRQGSAMAGVLEKTVPPAGRCALSTHYSKRLLKPL